MLGDNREVGSILKTEVERETGFEPATTCLEGRDSARLSYSRSVQHLKNRVPLLRSQAAAIDLRLHLEELPRLDPHRRLVIRPRLEVEDVGGRALQCFYSRKRSSSEYRQQQ